MKKNKLETRSYYSIINRGINFIGSEHFSSKAEHSITKWPSRRKWKF